MFAQLILPTHFEVLQNDHIILCVTASIITFVLYIVQGMSLLENKDDR